MGSHYRSHCISVLQESGDSTQHITSVKPVNDRDRPGTDTLSRHRSVSTWRHSLSQHRSVSTWTHTLSQHRSVSTRDTDTLSRHRSVSTWRQAYPFLTPKCQYLDAYPFPTPKCQYRDAAPVILNHELPC